VVNFISYCRALLLTSRNTEGVAKVIVALKIKTSRWSKIVHAVKVYGEVRGRLHPFSTSVIDGRKGLATRSGCFTSA
jgi:hypothetical protein